jgi:hypothetical protein
MGITLLGRFETAQADGTLTFEDTLAESLRYGDENAQRVRDWIDDYILENGIDAAPAAPDPAETVVPILPDPPIRRLDPREVSCSAAMAAIAGRARTATRGTPPAAAIAAVERSTQRAACSDAGAALDPAAK